MRVAFASCKDNKDDVDDESSTTLIGMEIPSTNGKYYPLPIKKVMEKAEQYFNIMPDGVFSMGRAGSYRYLVDIDDCIEQAMELARVVTNGCERDHPVLLERWRKFE